MGFPTVEHKTNEQVGGPKRKATTTGSRAHSASAVDEINAYIAVRDSHLAQAEQRSSLEELRRAELANTFVENCLKPARSPYEAQCLDEPSAKFERKRCEVIKQRIAELRSTLSGKRAA
jgi:hypothetical protein